MEWVKSSYSNIQGNCLEVRWTKSTHSVGDTNCLEARWATSRYSQNSGGNCVEARWATSSYSGPQEPNCLECRTDRGRVLIRDTQYRHLGHLAVPAAEWRALLGALRRGDLG